eukprot:maker-scaffold121_size336169-snap-gene-0.13 protein:Tk01633 transcript:maker-scaffold121_size336169-snap-gene-0.13-mRNA-1 annotation:"hypothetical protein BRAFLDRAFT_286400"
MQYTGSFKERGARYTLLRLDKEQKKTGVISASAGNHAQAMAYHGGQLGIPVTVVMPVIAPIMKVENCKKYGANVVIAGENMGDAKAHALKLGQERGLLYINGFDHPNILAGQGTMGLEILEQVPDVDAVVIPVGGGGLLAGCAVALKTMKPDIQIIGVEPELCASFTNAMKAGRPVKTPCQASLADGLTVPTVGVNALATAAPHIDKMVTVSEEWIAISILRLVEMEKAVVEGGGAAGVAAILAGLLPDLRGKKVVVPLCGGNIDTTILGRCLERGLAADGRLVKFTVTVSDRPGGIAELAKTLCTCGVSIKDMVHERAWIKNDIFSVECIVVVETRSAEHACQMFTHLKTKYTNILMVGVGGALGLLDNEEEKRLKSDSGRFSSEDEDVMSAQADTSYLAVKVLAETRNHRHTRQMVRVLKQKYDIRVVGMHDIEAEDDFSDDEDEEDGCYDPVSEPKVIGGRYSAPSLVQNGVDESDDESDDERSSIESKNEDSGVDGSNTYIPRGRVEGMRPIIPSIAIQEPIEPSKFKKKSRSRF